MNRRHQPPPRRPPNPAYRPALERLDAALEENAPANTKDQVPALRVALFGDVRNHPNEPGPPEHPA